MRLKFILVFAVFLGSCAVSYSSEDIIDPDVIDKYVRIAFSKMEFLTYHEALIQKGYAWDDVDYCNEIESEDPASHWVQMGLHYTKGNKVEVLKVTVNWNSKNGNNKVKDISLDGDEKIGLVDTENPK